MLASLRTLGWGLCRQPEIRVVQRTPDNKNNRTESKWSGFLPETSGKERALLFKEKHAHHLWGRRGGGGAAVPTTQEPPCFTARLSRHGQFC